MQKKDNFIKILYLNLGIALYLLISPFLLTSTIFAAGINVSPSSLTLKSGNISAESKTLIVTNPTADVQLIEIFMDEKPELISINPKSFILASGDRKEITIALDKKNKLSAITGIFSTNLSILASPLAESQVGLNAGVKIPITLNSAHTNDKPVPLLPDWIWLIAGGLIFGFIMGLLPNVILSKIS